MSIPAPVYPEYRFTLVWRSDADGNGIRVYVEVVTPTPEGPTDYTKTLLMTSFHPTLAVAAALESAYTQFFEGDR